MNSSLLVLSCFLRYSAIAVNACVFSGSEKEFSRLCLSCRLVRQSEVRLESFGEDVLDLDQVASHLSSRVLLGA